MKYDSDQARIHRFFFKCLAGMTLISAVIVFGTTRITYSQSNAAGTPSATSSPAYTRLATRAARQTSQVPVASQTIPGQTQVDPYTVALYHFDAPSGSDAIDATGNYTGTLNGNASVSTAGLYAGVLSLEGNGSYVRTGNLGTLSSGTIEAFVDFSRACPGGVSYSSALISAGGEYGSGSPVLELHLEPWLNFGIFANGKWTYATSRINACRYLTGLDNTYNFSLYGLPVLWPYETLRFHHVAGTWGPRGLEIWVDGVLHGVGVYPPEDLNSYLYNCNPQSQERSLYYPVCQTPVPAPNTFPPNPPGDYFGGLPAYQTFLIGCNADSPTSMPCFTGRIDEVRISNIQRTFQCVGPVGPYGPTQCVVPTVTPTPTQTPVPITGAYTSDSSTVALYHLDSSIPQGNSQTVLETVTQQYHSLRGQAAIVPGGRFNSGVALDGNGSFYTTTLNYLNSATIEAWALFSDVSATEDIFAAHQYYNSPGTIMNLQGRAGGPIRLNLDDGNTTHVVDSDVTFSSLVGCWHHIAGTWGPRGMEMWIDGTLRNTNGYTGTILSPTAEWRVGADFAWQFSSGTPPPCNCVRGTLDEVRVSNIQRRFSPQALEFKPVVRAPAAVQTLTFLPFIVSSPVSACTFGP